MDVFIAKVFEKYYRESPLVLVDVGARGGLQKKWFGARRHLSVIGFEPDKKEYDNLVSTQDGTTKYCNAALYKEKRNITLYLTRNRGVSSIYKPNRKFLDDFPDAERHDVMETTEVSADALDNVLKEHGISDVDFIKLDTQGSELSILEGSAKTIESSIFGLEVEVEFAELYEGQPLFADIDRFVKQFGFHLFDLKPLYWKRDAGKRYGGPKGQIVVADALYLRTQTDYGRILKSIADADARKSKVLRAVSVCIIHGYLDYALEIFRENKRCFSDEEAAAFWKSIRRDIQLSSNIPSFRGRGRVADMIYKLYKVIRPAGKGWAMWGKELGNLE